MKKVAIKIFISLAVIIIAIITTAKIYFTPTRTAEIVNKLTKEYILTPSQLGSIELGFLNFPSVEATIKDGYIVSKNLTDTLVKFSNFSASINVARLLTNRIKINKIELSDIELNAEIAADSTASWDIFNIEESDSDQESEIPKIEINRIEINGNNNIHYTSQPDGIEANVAFQKIALNGRLSTNIKRFAIKEFIIDSLESNGKLKRDSIIFSNSLTLFNFIDNDTSYHAAIKTLTTVKQGNEYICKSTPFDISGEIDHTNIRKGQISFNQIIISLFGIPTTLNGDLQISEGEIASNISYDIEALNLSKLIELVPSPELKGFDSSIKLNLRSKIEGSYSFDGSSLPTVNIDLSTSKGYLLYLTNKIELDKAKCNIGFNYDSEDGANCSINEVLIQGSGITIETKGEITDLLSTARLNGEFNSTINLPQLSKIIDSTANATGDINITWRGELPLTELDAENMALSNFDGAIKLDTITAKNQDIDFYINGLLEYTSTDRQKDSLPGETVRIIALKTAIDSMFLNYKDSLEVTALDISSTIGGTSDILLQDTTKVPSLRGWINSRELRMRTIDSTTLSITNSKGDCSIFPSPENLRIPILSTSFNSERIQMSDNINRVHLQNSDVKISATFHPLNKTLYEERLDSLQLVFPTIERDSLLSHFWSTYLNDERGEFSDEDFSFMVTDERISRIIRQIELNGDLEAENAMFMTPYFPLRTRISDIAMSFDQDNIELKNLDIITKGSQFNIKGRVTDIKGALLRNTNIKASARISSNKIDIEELMNAVNAGTLFMEDADLLQEIATQSDEEIQEFLENESGKVGDEKALIIVPANIDANIAIDLKNATYKHLKIDSLETRIISSNRTMQINNLKATTDAGYFDMALVYKTPSKDDVTAGIDMSLNQIKIERLTTLVPEIDTLLPMLRSFKGTVDCDVAATVSLNELVEVIPETIHAASKIEGTDMVLMDGETFADIAKSLKFKNKDENLIDKISVQMILENGEMNIFPFLMELDRYETAISGTHRLDMTYDYHISVLKSPLPFRLGINVTGDLEDFKFRLCKAKYKDENIPSYSALIDTTRIDLREGIRNIFKRGSLGIDMPKYRKMISETELDSALTKSDSLELATYGIIEQLPDTLASDSTYFNNIDSEDQDVMQNIEDKINSTTTRRRGRKAKSEE